MFSLHFLANDANVGHNEFKNEQKNQLKNEKRGLHGTEVLERVNKTNVKSGTIIHRILLR
jgi:hypothetical protein